MEKVSNCHLCGSVNHRFLFHQTDLFHGLPGKFSVWECQDCGLVFLNPRPTLDELMDFYPDSYVAYTKPLAQEKKLRQADRAYGLFKRLRYVKKFMTSGRILDVGCATGAFLTEIHKLEPVQWELYGLEPNASAADIAKQNTFIDISNTYLEDARYPADFFDVVTLWDVLEHVHDPTATLEEVRRILKPHGIVVFSIPNLDSWDATLFKQYWVGYDVPRHIHVWSDMTLKELLRKTGLMQQEKACIAGSYFYFVSSIIFFLHANYPKHWLTHIVEHYHAALPLRLAVAPYFWIADQCKKSTTVTIACHIAPV